jgi:predicted permease
MLVENFVIIPVCLALMEASKAGDAHILRRIANILFGVLKRPMVLGLIAGLIVSLAGVGIPEPISRIFTMLAASASALALFVIGGGLVGAPLRGNWANAVQIALGKLLLNPAMAALALLVLPALGLAPLTPELAAAVVISAAIPMFSIYVIFAQEMGHEGMASIAQITATSAAFVTLSALLYAVL